MNCWMMAVERTLNHDVETGITTEMRPLHCRAVQRHEKQKKNTQRMARSQTGSTTRSKTGDLTKKDGVKTGLCIHRGLLRMKNRWKKVKVQEQVIKQKWKQWEKQEGWKSKVENSSVLCDRTWVAEPLRRHFLWLWLPANVCHLLRFTNCCQTHNCVTKDLLQARQWLLQSGDPENALGWGQEAVPSRWCRAG